VPAIVTVSGCRVFWANTRGVALGKTIASTVISTTTTLTLDFIFLILVSPIAFIYPLVILIFEETILYGIL
jgi:hypothetical protein